MFDWLRKAFGDSKPEHGRQREPQPEPEFRPAKLPPRRSEQVQTAGSPADQRIEREALGASTDINRNDIEQIRIDIECSGESALSMMLHRDGTLGRSGNGSLPRDGITCLGVSDGIAFRTLVDSLDEQVFPHAGAYDMKEKRGKPVTYAIGFLGKGGPIAVFEFRMGLENRDAGNLVSYFDGFIKQAVALTEDWHRETLRKKQNDAA